MMASWFWLNIPLATVFFLAICGIPVWLVLRHPDTRPNYGFDYGEAGERLVAPASVALAVLGSGDSDGADARLSEGGRPALSLAPCPECGLAAEISDRFSLPSTEGPVDHVVLNCVAGHYFRMASDRLPVGGHEQLLAGQAGTGQAGTGPMPESKSGPGLSRLPGRLGVVGNPGAIADPAAVDSKDSAESAASSAVSRP
jgi:hypothetical protein